MLTNMAHGGKIAMLGIPSEDISIDWNTVVFNMLTIHGIYGREMYETWYKMTVMLQSGLDISPVITQSSALHRVRERLRSHAIRPVRQSDSKLDLTRAESRLTRCSTVTTGPEPEALAGFEMESASASGSWDKQAPDACCRGRIRQDIAGCSIMRRLAFASLPAFSAPSIVRRRLFPSRLEDQNAGGCSLLPDSTRPTDVQRKYISAV